MEQIEMVDFFISYTNADRAWAEWIAWELEENRYTTVLQAWDFRPGSNFVLEMQKAAENASRTIAVLSPDYLNGMCLALPHNPRPTVLPDRSKNSFSTTKLLY
ncbi:MAG: toll/interleukin-1 receptor domain-containing protein [Euryarchaeota archaeon]|nr:toll/interleukin-1 receptor domain-containing protein [Euryarchaeota archaeon]